MGALRRRRLLVRNARRLALLLAATLLGLLAALICSAPADKPVFRHPAPTPIASRAPLPITTVLPPSDPPTPALGAGKGTPMNPTLKALLEGGAAGLLAGAGAFVADQLLGGAVKHSLLIGASAAIPLWAGLTGYMRVQTVRAATAARARARRSSTAP